jgi:hypothetical protein
MDIIFLINLSWVLSFSSHCFKFFDLSNSPTVRRVATHADFMLRCVNSRGASEKTLRFSDTMSYYLKGPGPLQRGDNLKNTKIGCVHLKVFFSRTFSQNRSYLHESFLITCTVSPYFFGRKTKNTFYGKKNLLFFLNYYVLQSDSAKLLI